MDAELFIAKPTAIPTVYKPVRAAKRTKAAKYMKVKDAARILKIGNLRNNLGDRLMRHTLEVAPYDAYDSPIFVRTKLYENKDALVLEEYVRDRLALREQSAERDVIKMSQLADMFKEGEYVDLNGLWVNGYSIDSWKEYHEVDDADVPPLGYSSAYEFDPHSSTVASAWSCMALLRNTGKDIGLDRFLELFYSDGDLPRGWGRVDAYEATRRGIIRGEVLDAINDREPPFALGATYETGRCFVHARHLLKVADPKELSNA